MLFTSQYLRLWCLWYLILNLCINGVYCSILMFIVSTIQSVHDLWFSLLSLYINHLYYSILNTILFPLSNGQVSVFELNIEKRSKPERVRQTLDHSGHGVTVMTWDSTSTRIYVGDDTGKISVISVPSSKVSRWTSVFSV